MPMTDVTTAAQTDRHQKRPAISFEFFPPKTEDMERNLWDTINRLAPPRPEIRLGDLWRRWLDP
ncbi:5,10-methylenetetrahydrofolate reductase [Bradyrhizobium sp. LM6.11]